MPKTLHAFWKESHRGRSGCFVDELGQLHVSLGKSAAVMRAERYLDLREEKAMFKVLKHGSGCTLLVVWVRNEPTMQYLYL